ncbi:hypothetical protein FGF1_40180 [Flavobacteriaceae bacterium GF1]
MKLAKVLWSLGSLLVNGTIIIYIILSSKAPLAHEERYAYINENWNIYGAHWRLELFLMAMIAIGAFHFAVKSRKISWSMITTGQLILLITYPLMLGGYRNTPLELAEMANQMATIVFIFGNLVFLSGLFLLYLKDRLLKRWLKYTAVVLSSCIAIVFLITFVEIINWKQALMIGPLINILYLINAYYGLKMELEPAA